MRLVLAALLLAGCAGREVAVSDALTGAPLRATVRSLPDGRMLVEANGYETWSGPGRPAVALHPLWQARFAGERPQAERAAPPPPAACCPGTRAR